MEKGKNPFTTGLTINDKSSIVMPAVSPDVAIQAWKQFQEMKQKFLTPSDFQIIYRYQSGLGMTPQPFIKRSGWRKLATAFNISCEIVREERVSYTDMEYAPIKKSKKQKKGEEELGEPMPDEGTETRIGPGFVYVLTVRAIAPNGRFMDATGACATNERGFAHLEHDIRSTAETRAKSRAISDLIGGGESSAEDLEESKRVAQEACGGHEAIPVKQVKQGENKGRPYIHCPVCDLFEWRDEKKNDAGRNK